MPMTSYLKLDTKIILFFDSLNWHSPRYKPLESRHAPQAHDDVWSHHLIT